jgi:putative phosphoribosyl transferase
MKTALVISRSSEPFKDRAEAGRLLGEALGAMKAQGAIVLGIPRGGIIIAREIAEVLEADLDIILSRKLGAPGNPELAVGAVSEDGRLFLDRSSMKYMSISDRYIQKEKEHQMAEIAHRISLYRSVRPRVELEGRPVIVTDDGLATGATMQAALWAARQEKPSKLIAAVPVAPEDSLMRLGDAADEIVCLRMPAHFMAVGQFYRKFDQVEDEMVLQILKKG